MIALFSPDHDALPASQRDAIERVCTMAAANRASYAVQSYAKHSQAARKGWQTRRAR